MFSAAIDINKRLPSSFNHLIPNIPAPKLCSVTLKGHSTENGLENCVCSVLIHII